jgi:hypothetical protein
METGEESETIAESSRNASLPLKLTSCEQWCIDTIKRSEVRMSKSEVQGKAKLEGSHGESTVAMALAKLRSAGRLDNKREGGPRGNGYGLPEWD